MSTDNNRADIRMFESLQANQNAQTGMSQMAVFNDKASFNEAMKRIKTYEAEVKRQSTNVTKLTENISKDYYKIAENFTKFRISLQKDLLQTKMPNRDKLDDQEHDKLIDAARHVFDAASHIEDQLTRGHAAIRQTAVID